MQRPLAPIRIALDTLRFGQATIDLQRAPALLVDEIRYAMDEFNAARAAAIRKT